MTTDKLKSMCKRSIDMYGLDIDYTSVDIILDMCDNEFQERLNRYIIKKNENEKVFLQALGLVKFNEIKQQLKG